MLIGYVSDESYAALADVSVELHAANGNRTVPVDGIRGHPRRSRARTV